MDLGTEAPRDPPPECRVTRVQFATPVRPAGTRDRVRAADFQVVKVEPHPPPPRPKRGREGATSSGACGQAAARGGEDRQGGPFAALPGNTGRLCVPGHTSRLTPQSPCRALTMIGRGFGVFPAGTSRCCGSGSGPRRSRRGWRSGHGLSCSPVRVRSTRKLPQLSELQTRKLLRTRD